jgi:hypothetical protein
MAFGSVFHAGRSYGTAPVASVSDAVDTALFVDTLHL